jgi:hypothetical protein
MKRPALGHVPGLAYGLALGLAGYIVALSIRLPTDIRHQLYYKYVSLCVHNECAQTPLVQKKRGIYNAIIHGLYAH